MDSRNNLQYPFARPLSQPNARDPRQAPIPPPPYTLQAHPHRPQPSLNNDPFLPRRNERDDSRQELPKPSSQGPYSLGSYTAHLPRENLGTPMEIRDRPQENSHGGSWLSRVADGRADRYRHHATEGTLQFLHNECVLTLIIFYCILKSDLVGVSWSEYPLPDCFALHEVTSCYCFGFYMHVDVSEIKSLICA